MFRFAIVVSRFNEEITERLLGGAQAYFAGAGVDPAAVKIVRVPGAFEIPLAARRLAEGGAYDAIVCLGCLIKGDTMHFEYIAEAASHGIMQAAADTGIPIAFGLLTTLDEQQAIDRSRPGDGNKGAEAAAAAYEMATLFHGLDEGIGA